MNTKRDDHHSGVQSTYDDLRIRLAIDTETITTEADRIACQGRLLEVAALGLMAAVTIRLGWQP